MSSKPQHSQGNAKQVKWQQSSLTSFGITRAPSINVEAAPFSLSSSSVYSSYSPSPEPTRLVQPTLALAATSSRAHGRNTTRFAIALALPIDESFDPSITSQPQSAVTHVSNSSPPTHEIGRANEEKKEGTTMHKRNSFASAATAQIDDQPHQSTPSPTATLDDIVITGASSAPDLLPTFITNMTSSSHSSSISATSKMQQQSQQTKRKHVDQDKADSAQSSKGSTQRRSSRAASHCALEKVRSLVSEEKEMDEEIERLERLEQKRQQRIAAERAAIIGIEDASAVHHRLMQREAERKRKEANSGGA